MKKIILLIVLLQLLLLVNMPTANSYLMNKQINAVSPFSEVSDKENDFLGEGLNILVGFFAIKQIGFASAQEEEPPAQEPPPSSYSVTTTEEEINLLKELKLVCCEETYEGARCQDVASNFADEECAVDVFPARCEQYSKCELGCCFDTEEGTCSPRTPRIDCEEAGGEWSNDEACNIKNCKLGCCVIGDHAEFVTDQRCGLLTNFFGTTKDFREDVATEFECYALNIQSLQDVGACVIEGDTRTCKLTSEDVCLRVTGNKEDFHKNVLCTEPSLETNCKPHVSTGCVAELDQVYWFDSCGNRMNVYDLKKENDNDYKTKLFDLNESCFVDKDLSNAKICGGCDHFTGSTCVDYKAGVDIKPKTGEAVCRDLTCEYTDSWGETKQYKNGESWCVYDGYIGDGKDVVGSRHWRYSCVQGEIKVNGCGDYRQEICVQSEIKSEDTSDTLKAAACRINNWRSCLEGDGCEEDNSDCMINEVHVGGDFKFNTCVSKYPSGFRLDDEYRASQATDICEIASQSCTVVFEKKANGWWFVASLYSRYIDTSYWRCVGNCECLEGTNFADDMHELCINLGDCGSYVNIEGKLTTNHVFKGASFEGGEAKDSDLSKYLENNEPVQGQFAEVGNFSLANFLGKIDSGGGSEVNKAIKALEIAGQITGGTGVLVMVASSSWLGFGVKATATGEKVGFLSKLTGLTNPPWMGAIGNAASGAGIGMMVGQLMTKWMNLQGDAATIMSIVGGVVGLTLGIGVSQGAIACGPLYFICLSILFLILVIVGLLLKYYGIGDVRTFEIDFKCYPWEAPVGGEDCGKCHDDPFEQCTRYRCQSLGQSCEFIDNIGGKGFCINAGNGDKTSPIISSWEEALSPGYQYTDRKSNSVKVKKLDGGCVPVSDPIMFGLKTNEPAQCKIDSVKTSNFQEMEEYFGGSNLYKFEHYMPFYAPSMGQLLYGYNVFELNETEREQLKELLKEKMGKIDFYVRCRDKAGNGDNKEYVVNFCIDDGPDVKEPEIIATNPSRVSYLEYGQTSSNVTFYLTEPAECKWSYDDKLFLEMENNMTCLYRLNDAEDYGWPCRTNLDDLKKKVYVKCKDQPWETDDGVRNVNLNSYVFKLLESKSELFIDYVRPSGVIGGGQEPFTVKLEVGTSGGANSEAKCEYSFDEAETWITFSNTLTNEHTNIFNLMTEGDYDILIKCEDVAGNIAEDSASFTLDLDLDAPVVARAFRKGGIKLITNEKAICKYDIDRCHFNFDEAPAMATGYSTTHSAEGEDVYYVKCEDAWGNRNNNCFVVS